MDSSLRWFFGPYYRVHYKEQGFHKNLDFGRTFAAFIVYGECAEIFQQFMRTAYYIRALREQNAI